MQARLVSTQGPWLEAIIETEFGRFTAMDCIACDASALPRIGEKFDADLVPALLTDVDWSATFGGNPNRMKGLVQVDGWRYAGFGVIRAIRPTVVDCGILSISDAIHTTDARVVGEYVRLEIDRLDLYRKK